MSSTVLNVRRPVRYRGKPVENLLQRQLKSGQTAYDYVAHGKTRALKARTLGDALAELAAIKAQVLVGELPESDPRLTVARLVDEYLAYAKSRLAPGTHTLYSGRLRDYAVHAIGKKRAGEVDVRLARELSARLTDGRILGKNEKPMAGNSARGVLTACSAAFEYGVEFHGLKLNPFRQLTRKHRPSSKRLREPNYMSAAELEALLEKIGAEYRPLIERSRSRGSGSARRSSSAGPTSISRPASSPSRSRRREPARRSRSSCSRAPCACSRHTARRRPRRACSSSRRTPACSRTRRRRRSRTAATSCGRSRPRRTGRRRCMICATS